MGTLLDIELALQTKLAALSPTVDTAWPNAKYNETVGTSWIRPTLLFNRNPSATILGSQYHSGFYQVDVFTPSTKGILANNTILDNIYTLFRRQELAAGSLVVKIEAINRIQSVAEDSWWHGGLEINFRCFDY